MCKYHALSTTTTNTLCPKSLEDTQKPTGFTRVLGRWPPQPPKTPWKRPVFASSCYLYIYSTILLLLYYVLSLQLTAAHYDQNEQKYEKMRNLEKLLSIEWCSAESARINILSDRSTYVSDCLITYEETQRPSNNQGEKRSYTLSSHWGPLTTNHRGLFPPGSKFV